MEKTGRLRRKRIVLFLVVLLAIEIGRIEDEEENEDEIVATRDDFGSSQCTTPGSGVLTCSQKERSSSNHFSR